VDKLHVTNAVVRTGVNHGKTGVESPESGVGDANANFPQILSRCKISSARLLALQCSAALQ